MYTVTTVQENHFRTTLITQGINHHITQVREEDHQNEEIHRIFHKIIIIDQIVEITYNQQWKHLKPLSGNIYNFSIKQVHQYDKSQNKQQLFMSDFEFKPIHKFFKITISSIKYLKNTNSDIILLHVYNNTPDQKTLPLGLLGYCETNATISPIHEVAYRVNNILQLLYICQSTILDEELSMNNIVSNGKRNIDYFTKTPYFKPTFNITNYTKEQQKFLTMFYFEHSQITQAEFDKLAKQLLKYSTVYTTSKFDVGKISSSLHLPLKPDAVFKKQREEPVKYQFTYTTKYIDYLIF